MYFFLITTKLWVVVPGRVKIIQGALFIKDNRLPSSLPHPKESPQQSGTTTQSLVVIKKKIQILTSIWVLRTLHFQRFCAKKVKQRKISNNFGAHFSKKTCFLICTKMLVECFIPRLRRFRPVYGMRSTQTLFKIYNNQKSKIELFCVSYL